MNPGWIEDLAEYLDSSSTAYTRGTNLFVDIAPDVAVAHLALISSPGEADDTTFGDSPEAWAKPHLQLVARSTAPASGAHVADPTAAKALISQAKRLLDQVGNEFLPTSTGRYFGSVDALQTPFFLERDEEGRSKYACNFAVMVRGSTRYYA